MVLLMATNSEGVQFITADLEKALQSARPNGKIVKVIETELGMMYEPLWPVV